MTPSKDGALVDARARRLRGHRPDPGAAPSAQPGPAIAQAPGLTRSTVSLILLRLNLGELPAQDPKVPINCQALFDVGFGTDVLR